MKKKERKKKLNGKTVMPLKKILFFVNVNAYVTQQSLKLGMGFEFTDS